MARYLVIHGSRAVVHYDATTELFSGAFLAFGPIVRSRTDAGVRIALSNIIQHRLASELLALVPAPAEWRKQRRKAVAA